MISKKVSDSISADSLGVEKVPIEALWSSFE